MLTISAPASSTDACNCCPIFPDEKAQCEAAAKQLEMQGPGTLVPGEKAQWDAAAKQLAAGGIAPPSGATQHTKPKKLRFGPEIGPVVRDANGRVINAMVRRDAAGLPLAPAPPNKTGAQILRAALGRALGGGLPGALAMVVQVLTLMWMRTTVNYQYANRGMTVRRALAELYAQGGIGRFYQGLSAALLAGPLSRFGDTAANEGMKALLAESSLPQSLKTLAASLAAASWRIWILPIDTLKTVLQVEGAEKGRALLRARIAEHGPATLYEGAMGASFATLVGHYPWFLTFNTLDGRLPKARTYHTQLLRRAILGFCSSVASDCISNGVRVVTLAKQTSKELVGYAEAARAIVALDGVWGLLGRGLSAKIISNGLSAMLFTVVWKAVQDRLEGKKEEPRRSTGFSPAGARKSRRPAQTGGTEMSDLIRNTAGRGSG